MYGCFPRSCTHTPNTTTQPLLLQGTHCVEQTICSISQPSVLSSSTTHVLPQTCHANCDLPGQSLIPTVCDCSSVFSHALVSLSPIPIERAGAFSLQMVYSQHKCSTMTTTATKRTLHLRKRKPKEQRWSPRITKRMARKCCCYE